MLPDKPTEHLPTVEQQERIAAAQRALACVSNGTPVPEETAKLIALPLDKLSDPDAIVRAAVATKMRNTKRWTAKAAGVVVGSAS